MKYSNGRRIFDECAQKNQTGQMFDWFMRSENEHAMQTNGIKTICECRWLITLNSSYACDAVVQRHSNGSFLCGRIFNWIFNQIDEHLNITRQLSVRDRVSESRERDGERQRNATIDCGIIATAVLCASHHFTANFVYDASDNKLDIAIVSCCTWFVFSFIVVFAAYSSWTISGTYPKG